MRPPYNLYAFGVPTARPFAPVRRRRGPSLGGLGTVLMPGQTAAKTPTAGATTKVVQRYADGLKILVQSPGRAPALIPVNVKNIGAGIEVPSLGVTAPNANVRVGLVTVGNRIFWRIVTAMSGKQPSTRDVPYAQGQTKPPTAPARATPLVSVAPAPPPPTGFVPSPTSGRNDRFDVPPSPPPAEDYIEPEAGPEPVISEEDNVRRLIPTTGVLKPFAPAVSTFPASQAVVTMVPQRAMSPLVYVAGAAVAGVLLFIIWQRRSASVVYVAPQPAAWRPM